MPRKSILLMQDFFITQLNFWMLFTGAVTFLGLFRVDGIALPCWVICSLVPFLYYLLRLQKSMVVMMGGHVGTLFLPLLLPVILPWASRLEANLALVIIVALFGYSMRLCITKEGRKDSALHPLIAGAVLIIGLFLQGEQRSGMKPYYVAVLLIYILCYFLQLYIQRYLIFLSSNGGGAARMPKKEMFQSGFALSAAFACACMVLASFASGLGIWRSILNAAGNACVFVLRFLFRGLANMGSSVEYTETDSDIGLSAMDSASLLDSGIAENVDTEPAFVWVVLQYVIIAIVGAALLYVLIKALIRAAKYLAEQIRPYSVLAGTEEEAQDCLDEREKCDSYRRRRSLKSVNTYFSNEERVRRIYKRSVWNKRLTLASLYNTERGKGRIGTAILAFLTPGECNRALENDALVGLYEKARYADVPCTPADVKAAKEATQR